MSLILEALRKSEAERRRGQPPDLRIERAPAPAARRRIAVPPWAGIVLLALALALGIAGWWWLANRDDPPHPADTVAQVAPTATAPHTPMPASTLPAQALPARTPQPAPQASTDPAPATTAPAQPVQAQGTSPSAAIPEQETAPPAAKPANKPTPAMASPAPVPANAGQAMGLAELDPGTRNALPPLKLTMHMWNEDPSRRFVILDGQRLGEGDRIGEASVTRIERDGVLLDWQGRGIRVPVR